MDFGGILDGTWVNGSFKLTIKGNTYVSYYNDSPYGKGTINYDNENVTLISTHAHWFLFIWQPFVESVKGKYILANGELILSNVEGRYCAQNGRWVKMNGKRKWRILNNT
ncbi:hypothetical protein AGMMS50230_22500 [Spirochaetia bacterium]|nr:hypothetical protein AGMMS50230_22500 [Spirochaetia bacterium]